MAVDVQEVLVTFENYYFNAWEHSNLETKIKFQMVKSTILSISDQDYIIHTECSVFRSLGFSSNFYIFTRLRNVLNCADTVE